MLKRTAMVYGMCTILLMTMILRLYWVGQGETITQAMADQSRYTLQVGSTRGGIYDCNLKPLVGGEEQAISAVVPTTNTLPVLQQVKEEEKQALLALMEEGKPFLWQGDLGEHPGVEVFGLPIRYTDGTAAHVVGYLDGAGQGITGIEKACNDLLEGYGTEYTVSCSVDAAGHALSDDITATGRREPPGGVVLSLDRGFQKAAEQALADYGGAGAAVVMDIWTGEVKAMASTPTFDQNDVASALEAPDGPLLNRVLCTYNVGSSFQLAVAAAALEMGVPTDMTYTCPGYIEVEGTVFHCHNLAGHGTIAMPEAVQRSCNVYFIKLARDIGGEAILQTAQRLGFGSGTRLAEGMKGGEGELPALAELEGGELANFSFGQGKLTATPLQLASMAAAIANGGELVTPRLVLGTTDDGQTLTNPLPRYAPNRAISGSTAQTLQKMMVQVVEQGSGGNAKPQRGGAGGKTASAQTGTVDEAGEEIVHAWFVGFYPAAMPRWSVVTLCEGGGSGGNTAAPVFRQICDGIAGLGHVADDSNIP
ncbi:MAG: penicillin-binding protein 2 [Oscillospiraceae bacterium]|nr:penicillin-binding protein 2 [Oscillospiraceae bacterium]